MIGLNSQVRAERGRAYVAIKDTRLCCTPAAMCRDVSHSRGCATAEHLWRPANVNVPGNMAAKAAADPTVEEASTMSATSVVLAGVGGLLIGVDIMLVTPNRARARINTHAAERKHGYLCPKHTLVCASRYLIRLS